MMYRKRVKTAFLSDLPEGTLVRHKGHIWFVGGEKAVRQDGFEMPLKAFKWKRFRVLYLPCAPASVPAYLYRTTSV